MRLRTQALLATLLATAACTAKVDLPWRVGPPLSPSPCASPLWTAGMENGDLTEWTSPSGAGAGYTQGASSAIAVPGTAHTGAWAARIDLITPPAAAAMLGRSREPAQNQALFYEVWLYVPQLYLSGGVNPYWDLFEFAEANTANTSIFSVNVASTGGAAFISGFGDLSHNNYPQNTVPIPIATWFRLDAYYLCSLAPGGATQVAVWQDGTLLYRTSAETTAVSGKPCEWLVGSNARRLFPSPSRIFLDDAAIYPNCGS